MKRPLLWVAVLFIFGIVIADNVALDWRWPAALAGIFGLAALGLAATRYGKFLVAALVLLTGVAVQTIKAAARHYGVVIDPETLTADRAASERLRAARA